LLSLVILRSPSYTWISTPGWLSWYVEKVLVLLRGDGGVASYCAANGSCWQLWHT
jgi:hypothetical protein